MTVSKIEALRRDWNRAKVFEAVELAFNKVGFTKAYVDYARKSTLAEELPKSKVIKDNIWGMIEVEPSHIRLLDCPLIQRLRGIRQLGFSYLTYPTAEHSRFVHSLGMYAVVLRFLREFQRRGKDHWPLPPQIHPWLPEERQIQLLGHAALLHDVGHMPFSHVTEQAISANPGLFRCGPISVNEFMGHAAYRLDKSVPLAECLSIAVVLSDRFQRYFRDCVQRDSLDGDLSWIAAAIAGIPPEESLEGLASLISGPSIDADKVDYINRDSAACGIPVGIDISRLFLRSSLLTVQPKEIEQLTGRTPSEERVVFVVNSSGIDSIEEIVQSRTALYHRVYFHQTTRNAERFLAKALGIAARASTGTRQRTQDPLTDAFQLWADDDASLLNALESHKIENVASIGGRLRQRELPKRAAVFSRYYAQMLFDGLGVLPGIKNTRNHWRLINKQIVGTCLDDFGSGMQRGVAQLAIEQEIEAEVDGIARKLRRHGSSSLVPPGSSCSVSVLPMARLKPDRSDCIILEHSELSSSSASSISDEQTEATDIAKSKGYVLADRPWAELVFIASRTVLFRAQRAMSDIEIFPIQGLGATNVKAIGSIFLEPQSSARHIGLHKFKLQQLTSKLEEIGYYDALPQLASPPAVDSHVIQAVRNLQNFTGQGNWSVTERSVVRFVAQFPPRLRTAAIRMVESIEILGRDTVVPDIAAVIKGIDRGPQRGFIVGFSPDSGNTTRIQLEHELRNTLQKAGWTVSKSLREALGIAKIGDHLVLCDDNIVSGFQATCQFKFWLNADMSEKERRETGVDKSPLSENEAERFRGLKVHLVTALGTKAGQEKLAKELKNIGINAFQGARYHREFAQRTAVIPDLEPFLADVGASLLAWKSHRQVDVKKLSSKQMNECRKNALGYDGAKGLTCTLTNVPTGTVTALWCPGTFRTRPWIPLLLRRGYLQDLVLA